ncbi:hypothetical protein [Dietzia sp. PP-33]|uniref:hypothetical protein n=1 Tax=Dietzia sp. PP-33 TaxID=2957500 RepID=UPI0029A2FDE7|nr:hypothetical protein [Dietzia sp. PP-33]MDX2358356.1 hypothetical protein [Dietzia sp. PP-33]
MTPKTTEITADQVTSAAALVELPLSGPDTDEVADLLSSWMPAAAALSARMQRIEALAPITTFTSLSGVQNEEMS